MISYIIDRYFIKNPRLRRFVTSILERDRNLEIELAGAHLVINARREHGYKRSAEIVKGYSALRDEFPVLMNLFSCFRDGDTFVDIGANVGLYTHSASRLCKIYPNFHVHAFEANPTTYSRLAAKPSARVTYHNIALSDKNGSLTFVDGAVSHVFTVANKASSYNIKNEQTEVNCCRLDSLQFPTENLFLKIDVEGQEADVLNGAEGLFKARKIRGVYLDGYEDARINDILVDYGFSLFDGRTLDTVNSRVFSLLALLNS